MDGGRIGTVNYWMPLTVRQMPHSWMLETTGDFERHALMYWSNASNWNDIHHLRIFEYFIYVIITGVSCYRIRKYIVDIFIRIFYISIPPLEAYWCMWQNIDLRNRYQYHVYIHIFIGICAAPIHYLNQWERIFNWHLLICVEIRHMLKMLSSLFIACDIKCDVSETFLWLMSMLSTYI